MTEDEAKKRWCPFARVYECHEDGSGAASINRSHPSGPKEYQKRIQQASRCIGSGCMAWRYWGVTTNTGYCGASGTDGPDT